MTGFADISIFRSSRKMKICLRMYRSRTGRLLRWRRSIREIIDGTSELMSNVINNRSEQYDEVSDFHYTCYGCADDYIRFVRYECEIQIGMPFGSYEDGIWHYMRSDISAVSVYFMDPLE